VNRLKRWLILSVLLCVGVAHAADPLLISGGSDRAIPIAVVPFGWQGASALPEDIADIIGKDLRNSGTFQPIARQNMISQPAQTSEVIYRDWSAVGAQYVLIGNIRPAAGRLQVNYAVLNVSTEQVMLSGEVSGSAEQLRDLAHHIADQSYEKLTGVKGAFSTRLLYVTAERFSATNTRYTLQRADYDGARAVTLLQSREPILSPSFAPDNSLLPHSAQQRSCLRSVQFYFAQCAATARFP